MDFPRMSPTGFIFAPGEDDYVYSAGGLRDMAANAHVVAAFAHTSKPNMLRERMFAAMEDPRAQEAADLARRAGLDLPPGWLFNDRRSMPLAPTLALLVVQRHPSRTSDASCHASM